MNTLILVFSLLIASWLAWRFFLAPRLPTMRFISNRFLEKDGQIRIENLNFPDRHVFMAPANLITTNEVMHYGYGKRTATLEVKHITQRLTNERLLASDQNFGFWTGESYTPYDGHLRTVTCANVHGSPAKIAAAKRWLRQRGVKKTPDTTEQERMFHASVQASLAQFRTRFGYQEGDLDHIGFTIDLEPLTYTKLTPNGEALLYMERLNLTVRKPLWDMNVHGWTFRKGYGVAFFKTAGVDAGSRGAPISKAMYERIDAEFKKQGRHISWTRT